MVKRVVLEIVLLSDKYSGFPAKKWFEGTGVRSFFRALLGIKISKEHGGLGLPRHAKFPWHCQRTLQQWVTGEIKNFRIDGK